MNRDFSISISLSNLLNLLRWVSALVVLLSHLRSIMFIDLPNVTTPLNILWKLFYFITGFGHQAVIVFFILSGYLVGASILKRAIKNTLSVKEYLMIDRGVRIYLVVIPALIITYILDSYGYKLFNSSSIYSGDLNFASLNYSIIERLSIPSFLGNILMLQESIFPTFGSNSPLWSLAYEVWYYILFFSIVKIFIKDTSINKIFYFAIIILSFLILNKQIFLYFLIWLMGVAIWYIKDKIKINIRITLIFFIFSLLLSRIHVISYHFISDLFVATSVCFMILSFQSKSLKFMQFYNLNKIFSNFSYSLYVIHFPIIIFLLSFLHDNFSFKFSVEPNINYLGYFIVILVLIYTLAYLFFILTEKNTKKIQKRLQQ